MNMSSSKNTDPLDREEDLSKLISAARQVVMSWPKGRPGFVDAMQALAQLLMSRFREQHRVEDLDEVIKLTRTSLEHLPVQPPEPRGHAYGFLAGLLMQRSDTSDNPEFLDEALALKHEAMKLNPPDSSNVNEQARVLGSLASTLSRIYQRTGKITALDEAIGHQRAHLRLRPEDDPMRPFAAAELAGSLVLRYDHTQEVEVLNEALEIGQNAMQTVSVNHPYAPGLYTNYATWLGRRFDHTQNEAILDEVLFYQRTALEFVPENHPLRIMLYSNTAASLSQRYDRTGDVDVLDEAIALERQALELCPSGHPENPRISMNLGNSLLKRYRLVDTEDIIDEALELQLDALRLRPVGHPDRATSLGNIGVLLKCHYAYKVDENLLMQAITWEREVLELKGQNHPEYPIACSNLADSMMDHFRLAGKEESLEESYALYHKALELRPNHPFPNFGLCLLHLHPGTRYSNVSSVIAHFRKALELEDTTTYAWDVMARMVNILERLLSVELSPDNCESLLGAIKSAIEQLPLIASYALRKGTQLSALSATSQLGNIAFTHAIRAGNPILAIELLDQARGIMWDQALHLRNPQLADVPPQLGAELESLFKTLTKTASGEDNGITSRDERHKAGARLKLVLRQIRDLPGLGRFMRGSSYKELTCTTKPDPVVVLVPGPTKATAVIMRQEMGDPAVLELYLTPGELFELITPSTGQRLRGGRDAAVEGDGLSELDQNAGADRAMKFALRPRQDLRSAQLAVLWSKVVKPILDFMELPCLSSSTSRPRLYWCPTGSFVSLPLHAAGIYDGPSNTHQSCSDYVVSSYAPSLKALLRAQDRAKTNPSTHSVLALVGDGEPGLSGLPKLPSVKAEMENVKQASMRNSYTLVAISPTTRRTVSGIMNVASIVHLACHGVQDMQDPLSSGFVLSDGRLTLSDLMDLDIKEAQFAYLSACETAQGDGKMPDEVIHLAAGMMFAGFTSIVGTLWAMNDTDGPSVAEWFYDALLSVSEEGGLNLDAVPHALDFAVRKLRESGASPDRWATFIHMGA